VKELIFYAVAGTIIGAVAEFAGASLTWILLLSLLIPPIILLAIRILHSVIDLDTDFIPSPS
jgi:hypothetical protein